MIITDKLIESWLYCKYKSSLILNKENGQKSEYELVNNRLYKIYKDKYLEHITLSYHEGQIVNSVFPIDIKAQRISKIIMNPEVQGNGFSITFDAIEISNSGAARNKFNYIPISVTPKERIAKNEKVSLMVKTILLNRVANQMVDVGKIIYGKELRKSSVKIKDYKRTAQKVLDEFGIFMKGNDRPVIFWNDNCRICEFEDNCKAHLIEKDDLSLLGSLSFKDIIKRNKKGLFTINQLSYNFRPKRFKKTREKGRPFSFELKALAIRDNKTYVLDLAPEIIEPKKIGVIIDLKFTSNGIKRWVTQYDKGRFKCATCERVFTPETFMELRYKFGRNLYAWAINQHISYRMSIHNINQMLSDLFNIQSTVSGLQRSKASFAFEYKDTYTELLNSIAKGKLLHVDETQVRIKQNIKESSSGYVWVFANIDTACYLFKSNREADFLKELLNEFEGILVSDFYAGYDSIACPQQKCLIHLIRDLNDDLYKNPFDIEFKQIVTHFGKLLRAIIETIGVYGLKFKAEKLK